MITHEFYGKRDDKGNRVPVEMYFDAGSNSYGYPGATLVFHVQGEARFDAYLHSSQVKNFVKKIGYMPVTVRAGFKDERGCHGVLSFCKWWSVWSEKDQTHYHKIGAGTDGYGAIVYQDAEYDAVARGEHHVQTATHTTSLV